MFKCIVIDQGVQVGLNDNYSFIYSDKAYFITELPGNKVTITRRVNTNFHEVVNISIFEFVDASGAPIANNVSEFRSFMSQQSLKVKAGDGISVTADNTVSMKYGGPSVIGGYRVGTGLNVDGEGRLSATASSEVTKVLATEAEMLSLVTETLRPYRVIRMDSMRLYYLNAGDSPSVLSNWFVGPSIEGGTLSFNTRTGQVVSEFGDYNLSLVPTTDDVSGVVYTLVVENGELYLENTSDKTRIKVGSDSTLEQLTVSFNQLNDLVTQGDASIVNQVKELVEKSNQYDLVINGAETGLSKRIENLEDNYVDKAVIGVDIATLDENGKVPIENLPSYMPQRARAWRNVKASRVVGQYYTTTSSNDTFLHIRAAASQSTERYLHLYIRENNNAPVFDIRSDVYGAAGYRWCQISTVVPAGWQYALNSAGGSTTANIEFWYEMS